MSACVVEWSSARADWNTETSLGEIVELIAPQGCLSLINDSATLDLLLFEAKSVSVHRKQMFTRARFDTADME